MHPVSQMDFQGYKNQEHSISFKTETSQWLCLSVTSHGSVGAILPWPTRSFHWNKPTQLGVAFILRLT